MAIRICFVCLGNICRSPTAEGVMQAMVDRAGSSRAIAIESAGTGAWHVGEKADARAREVARSRGYELTSRAQKFEHSDFNRFDYILAMDRSNLRDLERMAGSPSERDRIRLFRSFDPEASGEADVPDPYYGGPRGFEDVLDMCERTCRALLAYVCQEHDVPGTGE